MYTTVHNEHRKILDICRTNLWRIVVYERYTRFLIEWLVWYTLPKNEPWELPGNLVLAYLKKKPKKAPQKNKTKNISMLLVYFIFLIMIMQSMLTLLEMFYGLLLGLCCLTPFSTIVQLFNWWRELDHWSGASHWQTLSYNGVSGTPRLGRIRTHNVTDDMHWLHK